MATTYIQLVSPAALPPDFWREEEEEESTLRVLRALKRAVARYGLCWLRWKAVDYDFFQAQVVEPIGRDFARESALPSSDLNTRASLPIYFSAEGLRRVLRVVPGPLDTKSDSHTADAYPTLAQEQGKSAASAPKQFIVYASLTTLRWSFATLEQAKEHCHHLSYRLRMLWFLRAALRAVLQDQDQRQLDDIPHTERLLRRALVLRQRYAPHISIEPRYEDGQLVGCELRVGMPQALAA